MDDRINFVCDYWAGVYAARESELAGTDAIPEPSNEAAQLAEHIPEATKVRLEKLAASVPQSGRELFTVDMADEHVCSNVLRAVALEPGENRAFLEEPVAGMPTKNSLTSRKPVLRIGSDYAAPAPAALQRSWLSLLDDLLVRSSKYTTPYQEKRGKLLEELAVGYLKTLLPGCTCARSLYYQRPGKGRAETDAIIVFDSTVIIVEAKAGNLTAAARRGAPKSLRKDFSKLIREAFEQGAHVRDYIFGADKVEFRDGKGDVALTLSRADIDHLHVITPTLASLGSLGVQLGLARELGLLSSGEQWPWCVFINDLKVVSELVDSPSEFLVFLERRLKTNLEPYATSDELDLLGKFFDDGLYHEPGEFADVHRVMLGAEYTDVLDKWYIGRPAGAKADKPGRAVPTEVRQIVALLEACGKSRRTLATRWLLELDQEAQEHAAGLVTKFAQQVVVDGKPHDLTMQSTNERKGLTLHITSDGALDGRVRGHAAARRRVACADQWLVIVVNGELTKADFEICEGQDSRPGVEVAATAIQKRLLDQDGETHGALPGRNEPCPCLSGKKFKKCCLSVSRS